MARATSIALGELSLAGKDGEGGTRRLYDGERVNVNAVGIASRGSRTTRPLGGDGISINLHGRLIISRTALRNNESDAYALICAHRSI